MTDLTHDERLNAGDERMERIEDRLTRIEDAQDSARKLHEEHRQETRALGTVLAQNSSDTREIREIVETGKALFRFGGWLAAALKWGAAIAAAVAATWAVLNGKRP